ncbi:MAG TPA: tRNA (cytidine(34)-2'-O)-methyltransferase [Vicinamibacteria bacterium]|nr:tRNA (cytidine(34)-2'-O)-methyltransferase [Vicinamibacteria bacterium]
MLHHPARALHVALVEPEIHWNTGNAGRTCLATGATLHLIQPFGFSLDDREVRRAGLDYWPQVSVETWSSFREFEGAISNLGEAFFFTPDAERTLWDVAYPPRVVLVFGSETRGLSREIRDRHRDRLVSLPMENRNVRALNLSTAVGVALYEVLRQWRSAGSGQLVSGLAPTGDRG